jgi:hypothetical protein
MADDFFGWASGMFTLQPQEQSQQKWTNLVHAIIRRLLVLLDRSDDTPYSSASR